MPCHTIRDLSTVVYTVLTSNNQAISSKDAAALDKDLMEIGGWSLDQLMELAGLSVSQAGKHLYPWSYGRAKTVTNNELL